MIILIGMFVFHTVVNLVATTFFIFSRLKLVPPTATRSSYFHKTNCHQNQNQAHLQAKVSSCCEGGKRERSGSWRIPHRNNLNIVQIQIQISIVSPPGFRGCWWHGREKDAVEPGSFLFTKFIKIPYHLICWPYGPIDTRYTLYRHPMGSRQLNPGAQLSALKRHPGPKCPGPNLPWTPDGSPNHKHNQQKEFRLKCHRHEYHCQVLLELAPAEMQGFRSSVAAI